MKMAMSLPTVLAELTRPRIFGTVSASRELIRGAPFQTLFLTSVRGRGTYAVFVAGGPFVSSCLSGSAYPASAIEP